MDPVTVVIACYSVAFIHIVLYIGYKEDMKDRKIYKLRKALEKNREWYKPKDKDIEYSINPMFSVVYKHD
jgi:hypothetical protein